MSHRKNTFSTEIPAEKDADRTHGGHVHALESFWDSEEEHVNLAQIDVYEKDRMKKITGQKNLDITIPKGLETQRTILDRIYVLRNWKWAKSYLTQHIITGDGDSRKRSSSSSDTIQSEKPKHGHHEDPFFYQLLLCLQLETTQELSTSRMTPGRPHEGFFLKGDGRILFSFAIEWVAVCSITTQAHRDFAFKELKDVNVEGSTEASRMIVRRKTVVTCVFKMDESDQTRKLGQRLGTWRSSLPLQHRRIIAIFNDFDFPRDKFHVSRYFDPSRGLWDIDDSKAQDGKDLAVDTPEGCSIFLQQFLKSFYQQVIDEWTELMLEASKHIHALEDETVNCDIKKLRIQVARINKDTSEWIQLGNLLKVQTHLLKQTVESVNQFCKIAGIEQPSSLNDVVKSFGQVGLDYAENVQSRGQGLASLAYNIIAVQIAESTANDSKSMKRLSWITFFFLPLVAVSGFFGMNVDIFEKNPSIKWYFIVGIPFLLVCLVVYLALSMSPAPADLLQMLRSRKTKSSKTRESAA